MSIRQKILAALNTGPKTMDEMQDALPDDPRKRIQDNITATIKDGLATRSLDDVTRQPLYRINEKGKERLRQGPGKLTQRKPRPEENLSISGKDAEQVVGESLRKENLRLIANGLRQEKENSDLYHTIERIFRALSVTSYEEAMDAIDLLHAIEKERDALKGESNITPIGSPKLQGYACMVGTNIHEHEHDAILEAESTLQELPPGGSVHVVGILHTAQNVVICQWKKAA